MVVWRGKGWIVIVLAFLAIGLPLELDGIYVGLGQLILFLLFACIIWLIGNKLNAGQNHYSQQAGKFSWKDLFEVGAHDDQGSSFMGVETSPSHSFTLIKMQYWWVVFVAAGIFCMIVSFV